MLLFYRRLLGDDPIPEFNDAFDVTDLNTGVFSHITGCDFQFRVGIEDIAKGCCFLWVDKSDFHNLVLLRCYILSLGMLFYISKRLIILV